MSDFIKQLRAERIVNFLKGLDTQIDLNYYVDPDKVEDFDGVYEAVEAGNGFDVDIIYYSRAMEYLSENDPSLNQSMEIAQDMGYEPKNINSELLASLLASREVTDEFWGLEDEITEFFDEISLYDSELEDFESLADEIEDVDYSDVAEFMEHHYDTDFTPGENIEKFKELFDYK